MLLSVRWNVNWYNYFYPCHLIDVALSHDVVPYRTVPCAVSLSSLLLHFTLLLFFLYISTSSALQLCTLVSFDQFKTIKMACERTCECENLRSIFCSSIFAQCFCYALAHDKYRSRKHDIPNRCMDKISKTKVPPVRNCLRQQSWIMDVRVTDRTAIRIIFLFLYVCVCVRVSVGTW